MRLIHIFIIVTLIVSLISWSCSSNSNSKIVLHSCMCDASAGIAIDSTQFIVANDEDNILRIYQNNNDGDPINSYDLTHFLEANMKHPEADIEGATKIGNLIFWITSHGTNKNGKQRESRHRFFATELKHDNGTITITPSGIPYKNLVTDIKNDPKFKEFNFNFASQSAPKTQGALNIEGLCATPDEKILIGFRNPIPDGKALIILLENPQQVILGEKAIFGEPLKLSLDNLGISSIEYFPPKKEFLIIAGPYNGNRKHKLFTWSGVSTDQPKHIEKVDFSNLNPEALVIYNYKNKKVQILSDDGSKDLNGEKCKNVSTSLRSFRSLWLLL